MVRKQSDRNNNAVSREKNQNGLIAKNRPNHQAYSQNQKNPAQAQNADISGNTTQDAGQGHYAASSRNGVHARNYGYFRDKSKDSERNPRHHSGAMSGRSGGSSQRNKTEETINDIKQDIIRLEKEIELEIKEIRSLKL